MKKEGLDIHHKEELSGKLRTICGRLSEFSFANLYLFRHTHKYEVVKDDDCLFVTGMTHDGEKFVLPMCKHRDPDIDHIRDMIKEFGMLYPISDCSLKYFDPREFDIYHNEDDSDYIYTVEKMSTYSGRKLAKKRNLLKQFFSLHTYERFQIDENTEQNAKAVLDQWQEEMPVKKEETDYSAACEAFEHYKELGLSGFVYLVDNKPGGYVLGEMLTDDTYALHFAKGLTEYKGIYQFMYNDLAKYLKKRCVIYMNFEQDLGLQSLRQAKSSYKPDHMGMKYRVTLKKCLH